MNLVYEAIDPGGRQVRDVEEAGSLREAVDTLRNRGLLVTQIEPARGDEAERFRAHRARDGAARAADPGLRFSLKSLLVFTQQMAMLLASGSAVVPALAAVGRQLKRPASKALVKRIRVDLEEGLSLTEALRKYPSVFDPLYCAMVAAGEASATLSAMFNRLAETLAKRRRIRNQLVSAMAYPALLIVLCVGILTVMLGFVIPRFGQMYVTLGVPLPTSTESMLAASAAIRTHWYVPVFGLSAAVATLVVLWRNRQGRQWLSDLQLRIPLYGRLASRLTLAQLLRVLGTLTATQVNLLESMDLARRVTGNGRYRAMIDGMEQAVTSGRPLAGALEESGLATPAICQAIQTGEESGNLGGAISFAADVLTEENVEWVNALTRLVEPVILIIMGAIVGGVAISLFLPLFDMTSAVR